MAEKKTPNYTDEQTVEMVERYEAAENDAEREAVVNELAADFGKTVRSIRAKLVREKVYIKKTYKTKTGAKPETKDAIVEEIANALGVASDQLGGLEKATKKALELIRGTLRAAAHLLEFQESENG